MGFSLAKYLFAVLAVTRMELLSGNGLALLPLKKVKLKMEKKEGGGGVYVGRPVLFKFLVP